MEDNKRFIEATEAESLLLFDNSNEIKEESVEFKDEPINDFAYFNQEEPIDIMVCGTPNEIKDEPIDDFSDVKQEEPIADLYCPSTGTSRPFNQNNIVYEGMRRGVDTTEKEAEIRIEDLAKSTEYRPRRTCDLCLEKTTSYSFYLINDPSRTQQICYNLIQAEHRNRIECFVKHKIRRVAICWKHFKSPSEVYNTSNKIKDEPIDEFSEIKHERPMADKSTTPFRYCDLCGIRSRRYVFSPLNLKNASTFFSKLIKLTPQQRNKSEYFIKNRSKATVCLKHVNLNITRMSPTIIKTLPKRAQVMEIKENSVDLYQKISNDRFRAKKNSIDDGSKFDEKWSEEPGSSR